MFALVNAVVFAAPTAKTPSFWIAYGFTAVAFAAQPFTGGESVRRPHKYAGEYSTVRGDFFKKHAKNRKKSNNNVE